jgi:peptidoglycan/LPS O-acetylase OafA/YrhL
MCRENEWQPQELQSLTPLRGLAATWVICFHYIVAYFGPCFTPAFVIRTGRIGLRAIMRPSRFTLACSSSFISVFPTFSSSWAFRP